MRINGKIYIIKCERDYRRRFDGYTHCMNAYFEGNFVTGFMYCCKDPESKEDAKILLIEVLTKHHK
jgi:hypothetical protein